MIHMLDEPEARRTAKEGVGLVEWIEHPQQPDAHENQREYKRRYLWCSDRHVHIAEHTKCPEKNEEGCDLHKGLVFQVIAWVDLKDEHMVDSGALPAVYIEAH